MSAPDTGLAKQKRRHMGPLLGMAFLVCAVLVFFLWFLGRSVDTDGSTDGAPAATSGAPAGDATDAPAAATVPTLEGGLPRE